MTHLAYGYKGDPIGTQRAVVGETYPECPDCLSRLVWDGTSPILFRCECEDDEGLAPVDILVEWNETWIVTPFADRSMVLTILEFDTTEDDDEHPNETGWTGR